MTWTRLVVAPLLLATLGSAAAAAESPEHQSKNARKVIAVLDSVGINNPGIKELVTSIDQEVDEEGYVTFTQHEVPGGNIKLHYAVSEGIGIKHLEVKFTPDDSNWRATVRSNQVMVGYKYEFSW